MDLWGEWIMAILQNGLTTAMKYPTGCNMTYTKEILQKAGGFNNQLTFRSDDKYIFYQVTTLSDKVYYLPDAMLYHNIDNDRLSFPNFKKLFLKSGNEEKIRVRSEKGVFAVLKKFFELIFKTGAATVLYLLYTLKGKELKGRYIFFSQWFTLKGFLMKRRFCQVIKKPFPVPIVIKPYRNRVYSLIILPLKERSFMQLLT